MRIQNHVLPLVVLGLAGISHAGQLVAVDSNSSLYDIDMATGTKTLIGVVSTSFEVPSELTRDPASGTVYMITTVGDSLFTLDIPTGTATPIGTFSLLGHFMQGAEWDSSTNTLYGGSYGNLFTIDTTTAALTPVGTAGFFSFYNLVYVPTTDTLYATNSADAGFYSVDRATGHATLIGPLLSNVVNPNGLTYDVDHDTLWMVDNDTDSLYTIDVTTGAATLIGVHGGASNLLGLVYISDGTGATSFCHGDGSGTACPCGNAGAAGNGCASSVNANGGNLAASGSASVSAGTLVLTCSGMTNGAGLYFQGTTQAAGGSGTVFGDGLRCAGGTVIRLGTKMNVGGGSHYPEPGDVPISVKGVNSAGVVRDYQCWYRNAAAFCTPSTFNLTNGLELTWQP